MSKPYTNRELDVFLKNLEEKNVERHKDLVSSIDALTEQVKKTNGQVVSLRLWRSLLAGGMTVVILVVVPLVVYAFNLAIKQ